MYMNIFTRLILIALMVGIRAIIAAPIENNTSVAEAISSKIPQTISTITFTPATLLVAGSIVVSATSSSGLPVTFTSTTRYICITVGLYGKTVVGIAGGECILSANQAGNTAYNAAVSTRKNITVHKASQTIGSITFAPSALTVGRTTTLSATATSRSAVEFSSTTPSNCAVLGRTVTAISAGVCTVAANQAGDLNYKPAPRVTQNITIGKGAQTIGAISFTPPTLEINRTTTANAAATSNLMVSFNSTTPTVCTTAGDTVTGVTAGNCVVTANQIGDSNWKVARQVRKQVLVSATVGDSAVTRYLNNNDGTITDSTTNLIWMRCSVGQIWDGTTCSGIPGGYDWPHARDLTLELADHNDWRLPNIRELQTILDRNRYSPAVDLIAFPNTAASGFWSASASADGSSAWNVDFNYGDVYYSGKHYTFQVRLVRGRQSSGLLAVPRPDTDYVDNGDGTVTHTPVGLMWKRCAEGQTWTAADATTTPATPATCGSGSTISYTWYQAQTLTSTFAGHDDWRVPKEDELISLLDYTIPNPDPAINATQFPNTPTSGFWSASTGAYGSNYAWSVNFSHGYADYYDKNDSFQVRLVRAGP